MTEQEMRADISHGMAYLDEHVPGWKPVIQEAIANNNFDMGHCDKCVWGNLEGNYREAKLIYNLSEEDMMRMGFTLPQMTKFDYAREQMDILTRLWKEALQ